MPRHCYVQLVATPRLHFAVNLHLIRAKLQLKKEQSAATKDKIKRSPRQLVVGTFTFFVGFSHNWHACYLCTSVYIF